jgi:hypothetical protein
MQEALGGFERVLRVHGTAPERNLEKVFYLRSIVPFLKSLRDNTIPSFSNDLLLLLLSFWLETLLIIAPISTIAETNYICQMREKII